VYAARSQVLELVAFVRPEVLQETGLGLVAARIDMGEVSGEEINQSVIVEVAPGGPDRMAAGEPGGGSNNPVILGGVLKVTYPAVQPQQIRLKAIVLRSS
jgi:hypothetical protein